MSESEIIPYRTKVRCKSCGHVWKPRSQRPYQCPRCWKIHTWEVVNEFDKLRQILKGPRLETGVPSAHG
jgi:Zn finger protein HypA/HybF involved in hydrogenase expression